MVTPHDAARRLAQGRRRAVPEKPCCQTGRSWIVGRLKNRHALAPLTGQDARALSAFLHLLQLYAYSDGIGQVSALAALALTLRAMQPSTRYLAKAAIPHALDWSDEDRLWSKILAAGEGLA